MKNRISKFIVVGSVGFIVDSSILYLYLIFFQENFIMARIVSFTIAVIITWLLNRVYTFKKSNLCNQIKCYFAEFVKYLISSIISIFINFGIYMYCIFRFDFIAKMPIFAVAFGSLGAMVFSYVFFTKYVFSTKNKEFKDINKIDINH